MLILHPKSVCDVCLETYDNDNVPHAIECGHIYCLSCLHSLDRPRCPLCRQSFDLEEAIRLHIDKPGVSSPTPLLSSPEQPAYEPPSQGKEFLARIMHVVFNGSDPKDVRELLSNVEVWLNTQDRAEYPELNAMYLLLFRYSSKKSQVDEKKDKIRELKLRIDMETSMHEAQISRMKKEFHQENEAAAIKEKQLRGEIDHLKSQNEYSLEKYMRLKEEYKRLQAAQSSAPLPTPPPSYEPRYQTYSRDRPFTEPDSDEMAISLPKDKVMTNDMFTLSPIPASAQISALRSTAPHFRALTEESDTEDLKPNPYHVRSIQPITIKPYREIYRKPVDSQFSLHDMDVTPRSLPRSSVDVNMSSCSSSPAVSGFQYSRYGDSSSSSSSSGSSQERPRRPTLSRKPTHDSLPEEPHEDDIERKKLQLEELLTSPAIMNTAMPADYAPKRRTQSPNSSVPVTRNPSPVSCASTSASAQNQPPRNVSRASDAAQQAQREREERERNKPVKDPTSATSSYNAYGRDAMMFTQPTLPQRPPYNRRPSDTGSFRMKSNSVSSTSGSGVSNLTRSLRANNDGQRVQ
ncbi:unnamed protein product [Somion occarium]|uniref:RING-type domain-containing protein n=1 Tax=Somion occarium TaxID=3059160 RepID=A0ABP1DT23_9APHY